MGFFDKLRAELIDIVEWVDDSRHTLVWRFPRYHNQIKHGAELIVRPGQMAVFVHRGELADVFEPGHYQLTTDNLPILSTLQGWKHGFESPFKSEVYFVNTTKITDLKWGTPNPIMMRDADFGPIRLRAFGTYVLRASDPKTLLKELVGTDSQFDTEEIAELMRSVITSALADLLGESEISALDLASNYRELSDKLRTRVVQHIDDEYGLDVPQLFIVNISLPEEVEKAIDTRSSMGVIGDLGKFQQFQMGKAMMAAAENPAGGGASEGMGMGMGFAMASQMVNAHPFAPGAAAGGFAPPPPPPMQSAWHIARNGQTQGPYSLLQLTQAITAGQVPAGTFAWTQGMQSWLPVEKIPQLAGTGSPPPPPPPGI